MTIQQINKKFIITKKESDMQKEQNYQTYILSQNIIHKYQGKRVQRAFNTHNRIVVVRQNQLIVLNANDTKLKSAININTDLILKFVANRQNYIAILFTTGVLEIRSLDNLNVVLHLFNNISFKTVRVFPILYWEDDDLYILNQNKIQIFNIYKKQRKVYSDLLSTEDSKKLLGIAESHLIDKQRIIIMHLADKLLLNIAPNPITQLPVANITKILTLSNRKYKSQTSSEIDRNPPRQYLVLVVDDRKLQVYNLMTMKQILQIEYERKEQEKMQLKTDRFKQYLLVTFISKKNKVKNNILYKVNTEQYYKGKQHLRNDSAFFQFSVQLHMKQDLMIFPSKEISHQHNRSITLDLGYHKYNLKKNNGQIVISTLVLNPQIVKAKGYKCQTNNSEWKQLRSWNEVISSYLQNKISIEKLNLILLETEQKEKQLQKLKKQKSPSTLKQKVKQKEVGQRVQKTKKKGRVMTQKECIDLENRYNQSEKYEKNILEEIKRQQEREEQRLRYEEQYEEYNEKFENIRNFNSLILNKSKGQEKWFFDLIKQFLNLQSLNIQNQDQLKIQYETTEEQNNSTPSIFIEAYPQKLLKQPFKSVSDLNQIRQQNKFKFRVTQNQPNQNKLTERQRQRQEVQENSQKRKDKKQRSIKKLPDQKKQKDLEKDKDRKKLQKSITGSKSSEQISKNGMVSKSNERTWKNIPYQVQRVKSSTSQDQGVSFLQIESKNQVLTKSQQNQSKPEDGLDRELQSQEQDELMAEAQFLPQNQDILYIEKFTSKLAESLSKAFEPLQKKLDKLDQKLGRTESIHIAQLRRCQKIINRQQNELNNIDMNFKGYFYEMLNQFDKNLQNGLKCYWNKIEQIDKRNTKSRDKAINDFGVYIDHQIKSRQQIFDHNRICIQNNLTHLRKKMNAFMENQIYHNIYHEFEEEADQVGQVEDWEHKYRNQKNHRPYEEDQQEDNEL